MSRETQDKFFQKQSLREMNN